MCDCVVLISAVFLFGTTATIAELELMDVADGAPYFYPVAGPFSIVARSRTI